MTLPISPPIEPMLSELAEDIPLGPQWRYEPKWDGFRAIVFCDQGEPYIQSRKLQPLQRYFPELVESLKSHLPEGCAIDGEIIIAGEGGLDFDALQQRLHPAASRVAKLAKQTPSRFVAFDVLAWEGRDLRQEPFTVRRQTLRAGLVVNPEVFLTPQTADPQVAKDWFVRFEGAGLDGIIAKTEDLRYLPGERVMVKVKHKRTIDCVVGGYRTLRQGTGIGSLLLGLYDSQGILHHVGHTSSFSAKVRKQMLEQLAPLRGGKSFGEGRTPGGPSRWAQDRDMSWVPLAPKLVCEVSFDYLQGPRFRHAATFLRWRPDKAPEQCTTEQIERPKNFSLDAVIAQNRA